MAGAADDAVASLVSACVAPLETGTAIGDGLVRAAPEMEAKLLDNKAGKLFRTENSSVVVVVHDSGDTCEIMALGLRIAEFDTAFRGWLADEPAYRIDAEANLNDDAPGGAYIARAIDTGFVQAFIQTQPDTGFVGITVSRVSQSSAAEELLAK
jgi:hypothetical protein